MKDCFVLVQELFEPDDKFSTSLLSVYLDKDKAVEHAKKLIKLAGFNFSYIAPIVGDDVCRLRILDNTLASFLVVKKSVLL